MEDQISAEEIDAVTLETAVFTRQPQITLPPWAEWAEFQKRFYVWCPSSALFLSGPCAKPDPARSSADMLAIRRAVVKASREALFWENERARAEQDRRRRQQEEEDAELAAEAQEYERQQAIAIAMAYRVARLRQYAEGKPTGEGFELPDGNWEWDFDRRPDQLRWRIRELGGLTWFSDEEEEPPHHLDQVSKRTRGPKIPTPAKYNGKTSFEDTIFAFESYLRGSGVPVAQWALHAGNLLEGQALQTYTAFAKPRGERTPTWEEFKECLSAFKRPDSTIQARKDLHNLQ